LPSFDKLKAVVSKLKKDYFGIKNAISGALEELSDNIDLIGNDYLEMFIDDLLNEQLISNFQKINKSRCQNKHRTQWQPLNDYQIKASLDRILMCKEDSISLPTHSKNLSELNLDKPWVMKPLSCGECGGEIIRSPIYVFIKPLEETDSTNPKHFLFDQNKRPVDEILIGYAIESVNSLGRNASAIINTALTKELEINNNISRLMIMPKEIYYTINGSERMIEIEELSDVRIKRGLGRDINNWLTIKEYEKVYK
jgi:hypothetical protein